MPEISRRALVRQAALSLADISLRKVTIDDSLLLSKDGRSDYTMVISSNASPSERHAAREFQTFLERMSGARLAITNDYKKTGKYYVLLGRSQAIQQLALSIDFDALGKEGFVLRTKGRYLIIAGGRDRGTLYGVYVFLEKLGCRWFTSEVSHIPKLPTIKVSPVDEIHQGLARMSLCSRLYTILSLTF